MNESIEEKILVDFLRKHIAEVRTVLLTEFDEERDYRIVAEGLAENIIEERCEELKKEGRKEGIKDMILTMLSNGATKETIIKLTGFSNEEYEKLIN